MDVSSLRSEAAVKRTSLENDVAFLTESLPIVNDDYMRVSKQYGELKGLLNAEENKNKLVIYLSESESIAQRVMSRLDSIQYRLDISRNSFDSTVSINNEKKPEADSLPYRLANLGKSLEIMEDIKKRVEATYAIKKNELNVVSSQLDDLRKCLTTLKIYFLL